MFFNSTKEPKEFKEKIAIPVDDVIRQVNGMDHAKLSRLAGRLDFEYQLAELSPQEIAYLAFLLLFTSGHRLDTFTKERRPSYRGNHLLEVLYPFFCACVLFYKEKCFQPGPFIRLVKGGGGESKL